MDKEQARFILQSFRPDGADAQLPEFAEALSVAAEDRELGDWLAVERAQDAAFAAALNDLVIPDDLRENILSVLRGEHPEGEFNEMDSVFIGALASVQPPFGLREQIVTAMKVETRSAEKGTTDVKSASKRTWTWLQTAAVAAALVLGAFVALELTGPVEDNGLANFVPNPAPPRLAMSAVERQSIVTVAGGPNLDFERADLNEINLFLTEHNLPGVTAKDLPRGMADVKAVGCKILQIGETNASLLCFDKDGQMVHLVVVPRENIEETNLATLASTSSVKGSCRQCPKTKVSCGSWGDKRRAFVLLSKTDPEDLRKFF